MYKKFTLAELVAFTKELKVLYVEDNKNSSNNIHSPPIPNHLIPLSIRNSLGIVVR